MFAPFHYAFVQRGVVEALLLSIPAGILGTWIVLRGLAFFSHAVGTAAFPGLVIAAGLGWPAPAGAALAATAYTFGVEGLASRRESDREALLFGSLLLVGAHDVRLAAIAAALSLALTLILGRRWLATGFEPRTARSLGVRAALLDTVLLATVAFAVVAALSAVGALLAAAEGVVGLWLSVELNAPPGAAIAVLAGGVFAAVVVGRLARPLLPLLALILLAGCGSSSGGSGLRIVATTTQIGDWTRAVGGENVAVHQILQPNTDPHEYEPRPQDVEATAGAKVVFENGDELDHWMAKVVRQAGGKPRVVVLGERVPFRRPGETSGPEASRFDPHWWHDPRNAEAAVREIQDALASADPAHRAAYTRRAAAYLRRLRAIDTRLAACFERLPPAQRKLVTDHDAFGYFAHRYGLDVVGAVIPSQTTQAQPSAGATARLVRLIRREHVRAVFPESSINRRLAETIARETGATSRFTLYGDTLGPAGSAGATYLGMEQTNADAIVRGLSGGRLRCR